MPAQGLLSVLIVAPCVGHALSCLRKVNMKYIIFQMPFGSNSIRKVTLLQCDQLTSQPVCFCRRTGVVDRKTAGATVAFSKSSFKSVEFVYVVQCLSADSCGSLV